MAQTSIAALVAASALYCSLTQAAPVHYQESVSGDIAEATPPTFVLDAGTNTVSGTQSISYSFASNSVTADRDPFSFTVPVGMQLTGFALSWSNWQPTGHVVTGPGNANGFFSCTLSDASNVALESVGGSTTNLCVSLDPTLTGSLGLFTDLTPLSAGTYGWSNIREINYTTDADGSWSLDYTVTLQVSTVPAPGSLSLAGLALAALGFGRRRRCIASANGAS